MNNSWAQQLVGGLPTRNSKIEIDYDYIVNLSKESEKNRKEEVNKYLNSDEFKRYVYKEIERVAKFGKSSLLLDKFNFRDKCLDITNDVLYNILIEIFKDTKFKVNKSYTGRYVEILWK